MKLSFAILVSVVYSELADDTWYGGTVSEGQFERNYVDLLSMVSKRWRKSGATGEDKFDPGKHWSYGCCCSIGLSHVTTGHPVDAFDQTCRKLTECLNCVRDKYGEDCNHNTVRYIWRYSTKRDAFEAQG